MKYLLLSILILLVVLSVSAWAGDADFDFDPFLGDWQGSGSIYLPVAGMSVPFDGEARFGKDTASGDILTGISGSTMLLAYSDSGRMVMDSDSDSLSWEVHDSFGRHVTYRGIVLGNTLVGRTKSSKLTFTVAYDFVSPDSLLLKAFTTTPSGETTRRAELSLGRVQ